MSLDDRRFAAGMKRAEAAAKSGNARIASGTMAATKQFNRGIGSVTKFTGALAGISAGSGAIGLATAGMKAFAEATNDASGKFTRLTTAWQGWRISLGETLDRTGAAAFGSRAGRFLSSDAGVAAQRADAIRVASTLRDEQRADALRSQGDRAGADRIGERLRHEQAVRELDITEKQLQFLGLSGAARSLRRGESERHLARIAEIDREEKEREKKTTGSRFRNLSGGNIDAGGTFLPQSFAAQLSPGRNRVEVAMENVDDNTETIAEGTKRTNSLLQEVSRKLDDTVARYRP